jgi:hypothetical protein
MSNATSIGTQSQIFGENQSSTGISIKIDWLTEANSHQWFPLWRVALKRKSYWEKYIMSPPSVFTQEEELVRLDIYLALASTVTTPFKNIVLRHEGDPAAAWKALEERFKGNDKMRKIHLKSRLQDLAYDHSKGTSAFFLQVRDLYTQILNFDDSFSEFEVVHMILPAFPKDMFDSVKVMLKNLPDVTINHAEYMLTSQEVDVKKDRKIETAYFGRHGTGGKKHKKAPPPPELIPKYFEGPNCWHCNDPTHRRLDCAKYKAALAALKRGDTPQAAFAVAGGQYAPVRPVRNYDVVEMGY